MRIKTVTALAMAALLIGSFGVAGAAANDDAQSEVTQVEPVTPPDTPEPADPPSFTCPTCGADCPVPYGRRGRGVRAPKGRSYRGSEFRGRGNAPRWGHGRNGFGRGEGVPADRMLRSASRLDLTEDQITQLEKLAYDAKSKLIDLDSDLEKASLEMKRQMETDGDNLSAMKKHLDSMAKIRVNIQELKLKNWIDAKSVLTDEQKQQVKEQHPRFGMKL